MAIMIPPIIPPETRSGGEREVFRRLREDPATHDWIVLHSLTLAEHDTQIAGEIDFLVIIPGKGVLCLEVKGVGAAHLRRDAAGRWYYGPNGDGDPRGPFRQASEGMHTLRGRLLRTRPELKGVQFSSGVIFPFASFTQRSVEWSDWEVIDSRRFRSAPISRLLIALMESAREHLLRAPTAPRLDSRAPSPEQCVAIRDTLRGGFELAIDRNARAEHLERELIHYTKEQFGALDAMADNPRMIFTGPAGVGKTLLAIEAARRARDAGRRVLLVCFNSMLGAWLERSAGDLRPEVVTGTLHSHMLAASSLGRAPAGVGTEFWRTTLPDKACERLLTALGESDCQLTYDELIVDEAQDILREPYLDFLDLSLHGGLAAGRWSLFGDFENQAIYDAANMTLAEFREQRGGNAPTYSLRVNCRNTPMVTEWVRLLARLEPNYHRVLRPDDGVSPDFSFYRDDEEQSTTLVEVLAELESLGFHGRDIVVLSPRADHACAAARINARPWRDRLGPLARVQGVQIGYGTIHGFKGLEAAAVVVTDIETIDTPRDRALFYVATTRPLQRLRIIAHERVRNEVAAMVAVGANHTEAV